MAKFRRCSTAASMVFAEDDRVVVMEVFQLNEHCTVTSAGTGGDPIVLFGAGLRDLPVGGVVLNGRALGGDHL